MNTQSLAGFARAALPACIATVATVLLAVGGAAAQPASRSPLNPPANGPRRADSAWHALTNATIHTKPGETITGGTVVIRDGRIVSVSGDKAPPPAGAQVWDCSGLHIYPGFIDAYVEVEAPVPDPNTPGVHWNARVTPQRSALDGAGLDDRTAESLRKLGFTAAAISPQGGIFRGRSAVVSLAKPASDASADRPPVYSENAYHTIAFETGRGRGGGGGGRDEGPDVSRWSSYPGSEMGAIALIRQTLIDQEWQDNARKSGAPFASNALDSLNPEWARNAPTNTVAQTHVGDPGGASPMPLLFDTEDELQALRAAKIAKEFKRSAMLLGSGYEFRRLDAIKADGLPIILPLRFPRAPDVASIGKAESVELRELMTWEQAPTNPRRLDAAGVKIALTTAKLRNRSEFEEALTKAIRHGLSPDRALAMLTTQPAELLGISDRLGAIEPGKVADLVVADGDLFEAWPKKDPQKPGDAAAKKEEPAQADAKPDADARRDTPRAKRAKIRDVWIDGLRHEISPAPEKDAVGLWAVIDIDGKPADPAAADAVTFTITPENAVTYRREGKEEKASNVRISGGRVEYTIDAKKLFGIEAVLMDQAWVEADTMTGITPLPSGKIHKWTAKRLSTDPKFPESARAARPAAPAGPAGRWVLTQADGNPLDADSPDTPVVTIKDDNSITVSCAGQETPGTAVAIAGDRIDYTFDAKVVGAEGSMVVRATRDGDTITGTATLGDEQHTFAAKRADAPAREPGARTAGRPGRDAEPRKDPEQEERDAIAAIPEKLGYPFGPYMLAEIPPQEGVVFLNATIWTASQDGNVPDGWLLIDKGKIQGLGVGKPPIPIDRFKVIDLKGAHISPGIIDCHSHTGISRGVNEGGQAVTSEVRIEDVTDPDAISWYRQLAAGVTTVNQLHGSANAIGGQNCVTKIRWGVPHPDQMHLEGAMPGIKFALGENPKHTNAGDRNVVRYPQTRMGVEALIRDRFTAAKQYLEAQKRTQTAAQPGRSMAETLPPRRDLELEALAEILEGKRLIHCHSYRQDEILMLCRIADEFGFKIGTFQHILEGYKVADEIAKHAIGASAFSDWWAYKVEVQDAIPQGGPIMAEQGVVVSFNSDSDELARRLNTEAGKAIKYGQNVRPERAIQFVTANPAKQLMIERRVGTIEVGRDADIAIWSGPPMSSLSRCIATYVDGRRYFSLEDDAKHRATIAKERARLIQKALAAAKSGRPGGAGGDDAPRTGRGPRPSGMLRDYYLDLINRGGNPDAARPGDCGCDELHW